MLGGISPLRSLRLRPEDRRSDRWNLPNDLSSKKVLERNLKSMVNSTDAASSKKNMKRKYLGNLLIFKINVILIFILLNSLTCAMLTFIHCSFSGSTNCCNELSVFSTEIAWADVPWLLGTYMRDGVSNGRAKYKGPLEDTVLRPEDSFIHFVPAGAWMVSAMLKFKKIFTNIKTKQIRDSKRLFS